VRYLRGRPKKYRSLPVKELGFEIINVGMRNADYSKKKSDNDIYFIT